MSKDLLDMIQDVIDVVVDEAKDIKEADGFVEQVKEVVDLIVQTIKAVEDLFGSLEGQDKKALVKAALVELYEDNVDIPLIPNSMEFMVIEFMVDMIVDKIVEELNDKGIFE